MVQNSKKYSDMNIEDQNMRDINLSYQLLTRIPALWPSTWTNSAVGEGSKGSERSSVCFLNEIICSFCQA